MLKTGIVLEINKASVYIMSTDNEFSEIKIKAKTKPQIGEIYTSEIYKKSNILYKLLLPLVSFLLVLFILLALINKYTAKYSVVVDINSSIELQLNSSSEIIDVKPLNNKAVNLINDVNLKNRNLNDSLIIILNQAKKFNYLNDYYSNKEKTISIYITSHNNINIDLSSFEQAANDDKVSVVINDNGTEHQFLYNKSSELK